MSQSPPTQRGDAATEIRRKALSGVALVAGRETIVKIVALLGNIVFARLLSPRSFGQVAFGLGVLYLGQLLSDGGLGVGLIRRPQEPDPEDLRVLLGYQLVLTVALAALVAPIALSFGRIGQVTAVMMPALPLLALRAPSSILFERALRFAPLIRVEIAEEVSYYIWGTVLLLLGAGVWGLASASVIKALVGTSALLAISPVSRLRPSYRWHRLKPLLGFGLKFQGVQVTNAAGMQLLTFGIAGIAGATTLGLWTLAWRLAQIPYLLFGALWRVSFPAAAQLLAAGESAKKLIERGLGLAAVGTGAVLAPATGALSPLIPLVFGSGWSSVGNVLPVAFFALQASGPVSVATAGYLYAVGDTATVLRAAAVTSVLWLVVALPLLPVLGVVAVGVGWASSSLIESLILAVPVRRRTGAAFLIPLLVPWASASLSGAAGLAVSRTVSHGLAAGLLGAGVATCGYVGALSLLRREALFSIIRLARLAVRRDRRQSDELGSGNAWQ